MKFFAVPRQRPLFEHCKGEKHSGSSSHLNPRYPKLHYICHSFLFKVKMDTYQTCG